MGRKHISDKKRAAIFALALGDIPYTDAKKMTEDQILSLYELDHNMLHTFGSEGSEHFSNYTPMPISAHREKTKRDLKIIAKSRRILSRRMGLKEHMLMISREMREFARNNPDKALAEAFTEGMYEGRRETDKKWAAEANRPGGALRWSPVTEMAEAIRAGLCEGARNAYDRINLPRNTYSENYSAIDWNKKSKRKIRSRGFDKTRTKGFDGKVRKRRTKHASRKPYHSPP
jgi:hypothetical protein